MGGQVGAKGVRREEKIEGKEFIGADFEAVCLRDRLSGEDGSIIDVDKWLCGEVSLQLDIPLPEIQMVLKARGTHTYNIWQSIQ